MIVTVPCASPPPPPGPMHPDAVTASASRLKILASSTIMALAGSVKSFLVSKFWRPVADESVYYNPFNTAVYAGLFALAAAYVGKPAMKRLDLEPRKEFFIAVAPFVLLGGAARSLKDLDVLNTILLETPFIYVVMFLLVAGALGASREIEKRRRIEYWKTMAALGSSALLAVLSLYSYTSPFAFIEVAVLLAPLGLGTHIAGKKLLDSSLWFSVPVSAHWFDAATSIVALGDGANEKHVVAQFFVESLGPTGMLLVKLLLVVPAVYYVDENVEGFDRRYYLFLIALLGVALGTRNLISTAAS